jgi:phosphoribosylanthranilate isomerase
MNKVYSFSAKNEADMLLIEKLKKRAKLRGISFSWTVLQAIKQYIEADKLNEDNRKD